MIFKFVMLLLSTLAAGCEIAAPHVPPCRPRRDQGEPGMECNTKPRRNEQSLSLEASFLAQTIPVPRIKIAGCPAIQRAFASRP